MIEIDVSHMADENDRATISEMLFQADAVAHARKAVESQIYPGFDGHCFSCDTEVPKPRIDMGRILCTQCQTTVELRRKQFGASR